MVRNLETKFLFSQKVCGACECEWIIGCCERHWDEKVVYILSKFVKILKADSRVYLLSYLIWCFR